MESAENQGEADEPATTPADNDEVEAEDFENDPSRNPDDPEWKALKGG